MALSNEEALILLSKPKNSVKLKKLIEHENRLKFHTEIVTDVSEASPYYLLFLKWINTILTAKDKQEQFKKLLTFPIRTNELIDKIQDEYLKVFDAQDSYFNIEFTDSKFQNDFETYLKSLKDTEFWRTEAFEAMMCEIGSVLVIDLDVSQPNELPKPYYHLVDTDDIVDYKENEYFAFNDCNNKYIVIDTLSYKVYQKVKNEFYFISEYFHNLNQLPCKRLWDEDISPISSILTHLDWLLYFETSKGNLDLYASYPIVWAYQDKCEYVTPQGSQCNSGYVTIDNELCACPSCSSGISLAGAGSQLDVPTPKNGVSLSIPPAGLISVDRNSLDYNTNECERLKADIYSSATGKNKFANNQAINKDQVQSQNETQTNVLNWIARNLEISHSWCIDVLCKLRYSNNYISNSISYGTKFYLLDISDAISDFQNAKNAGLPSYILTVKMNVINHLQSKSNPNEANRINILKSLEPYAIYSVKECKELGFDLSDRENYILKSNFLNFIDKFENENGNIVEFGSKLSFDEKIRRISDVLYSYIQSENKPATVANALRDSVGGLTGMIEVVKAVASGLYQKEAAAKLVADRFGLSYEDALLQIGDVKVITSTEKTDVVSKLN